MNSKSLEYMVVSEKSTVVADTVQELVYVIQDNLEKGVAQKLIRTEKTSYNNKETQKFIGLEDSRLFWIDAGFRVINVRSLSDTFLCAMRNAWFWCLVGDGTEVILNHTSGDKFYGYNPTPKPITIVDAGVCCSLEPKLIRLDVAILPV
jgi:hypothetical protein